MPSVGRTPDKLISQLSIVASKTSYIVDAVLYCCRSTHFKMLPSGLHVKEIDLPGLLMAVLL
jgi:hypothetical protein